MTEATNTSLIAGAAAAPAAPVILTKAEKLARIDEQIAKLQQKRYNIEHDIVVAKAPAKVIPVPAVGEVVTFNYGRKTATTSPVEKVGTVVAVKPAVEVDGKKLPAQLKVQVGEGFDVEFVTIYPAQVVSQPVTAADAAA